MIPGALEKVRVFCPAVGIRHKHMQKHINYSPANTRSQNREFYIYAYK